MMTISTRLLVALGAVLGLLLMVIGGGTHSTNLVLAGQFIFAFAFLWGGLSPMGEDMENKALRITMLAIGGLFVISAFASSISLASLFTR
jgi:hypothetical protein